MIEIECDEAGLRSVIRGAAEEVLDRLSSAGALLGEQLELARNTDPEKELRADVDGWRENLRCWTSARRRKVSDYVYAVQWRDVRDAPVKIGRTASLLPRLLDLQRMSPLPLKLVGLIHGGDYERGLHERFAAHRLHGEWFDGAALRPWLAGFLGRRKCEWCP